MTPHAFTIAGAGLGGSLMAVYLARAGHRVRLLERRADPRAGGETEGRSINLALSTRGLAALAGVGLADRMLEVAIPMRGRMMHDALGKLTFQPYGTAEHHVIHSVSRSGLNRVLSDAARAEPNVRVRFDATVRDLDVSRGALTIDTPGGGTETIQSDVVVGADGAFSRIRSGLERVTPRFSYEQSFLEYGYKELTIPAGRGSTFQLDQHALHIWPRGGTMLIALPNLDGSFTCTLFWPYEGPFGLDVIETPNQVTALFRREFPDALALMPTLTTDFFANPTGSLVTIRCAPWHFRDKVVLLGDACHAVVPFYGQGANAAFEDCIVLDERIRSARSLEEAFHRYFEDRKRNADTIADLALKNFVEMRDRVQSTRFLIRKKLEALLHRLLPGAFIPLYTMVTFTRIPYADAVARARVQDRVLTIAVVTLLVAVAALVILALS